jgi:hypothetical protein
MSAVVGGEWSVSCPGCFTQKKEVNRRLSGPKNKSGRSEERNNLALEELEIRIRPTWP